MSFAPKRALSGAVAVSLGLALASCGGMPDNASLYSVHQPVVERTNFTLDVQSGPGGLTVPEQQRLDAWFEAMGLGYGDRVSIDDPANSGATRDAVMRLAERRGVMVAQGAPATVGYVEPGQTRIVITRSSAYVPGCPDWSAKSDMNYNNATSSNYGCATNTNLAAMVANPQDLIEGQSGTGTTVVSTSNKAIDTYRETAPTGAGGLQAESATGD
ncbi:CpaD family pilus assembly protein [Qipengyuania sp. JC766]|uniref:CpaD family pilus assembly protein n=1 Tax=Qipengyuania sp. JC766 TaxID=3232139 RepID=UPI00345A96A8